MDKLQPFHFCQQFLKLPQDTRFPLFEVKIRLLSWFSIAFNRSLQRFSWPDPPQLTNHLVFGRAEQICMKNRAEQICTKNSYNENKVIPGKSSRRRKSHLIDLLLNNLMSFKTQCQERGWFQSNYNCRKSQKEEQLTAFSFEKL
jgi:hypothetical protein